MVEHFHYLVWIDHQVAKIVAFNATDASAGTVHSTHRQEHLRHKANADDSGHVSVDEQYLERVANAG